MVLESNWFFYFFFLLPYPLQFIKSKLFCPWLMQLSFLHGNETKFSLLKAITVRQHVKVRFRNQTESSISVFPHCKRYAHIPLIGQHYHLLKIQKIQTFWQDMRLPLVQLQWHRSSLRHGLADLSTEIYLLCCLMQVFLCQLILNPPNFKTTERTISKFGSCASATKILWRFTTINSALPFATFISVAAFWLRELAGLLRHYLLLHFSSPPH